MDREHELGWQMREDEREALRIDRERTNMIKEYLAQTKVDNFWGIPTELYRRWLEEERRRKLYEELVERQRVMCLKVGIIKPSPVEAVLLKNSFHSSFL